MTFYFQKSFIIVIYHLFIIKHLYVANCLHLSHLKVNFDDFKDNLSYCLKFLFLQDSLSLHYFFEELTNLLFIVAEPLHLKSFYP